MVPSGKRPARTGTKRENLSRGTGLAPKPCRGCRQSSERGFLAACAVGARLPASPATSTLSGPTQRLCRSVGGRARRWVAALTTRSGWLASCGCREGGAAHSAQPTQGQSRASWRAGASFRARGASRNRLPGRTKIPVIMLLTQHTPFLSSPTNPQRIGRVGEGWCGFFVWFGLVFRRERERSPHNHK